MILGSHHSNVGIASEQSEYVMWNIEPNTFAYMLIRRMIKQHMIR